MPKNQSNPKAKKYRHDTNHAESLDNIDFFGIIGKNPIILVYDPQDYPAGLCFIRLTADLYTDSI